MGLSPVQEIVGGKDDGETVWAGFNFDVLEFLNELEPESLSFSTRQLTRPRSGLCILLRANEGRRSTRIKELDR
jgi:hypothetical protein